MKLLLTTLIIMHTYTNAENLEKIYAVMITGKDVYHKALAQQSIKSFLKQTYTNKYLIIINDGDYSLNVNSNKIKEIKLNDKQVLGALRNIGLAQIPENGVYLQWDDDDWHHPKLMEEQYKQMISAKAEACLLQRQVQYSFNINASWVKRNKHGIMGTIMCRKKNHILYPLIPKSEDKYFLQEYTKYKITVLDNPEYYYLRFIHGHNTWDEKHFALQLKQKDKYSISVDAKKYLSQILPDYNFIIKKHKKFNV